MTQITKAELLAVAGKQSQFPVSDVFEVAFSGKSNVGKSSLINSMLNRKSLARTSGEPGKTRTINFYNVEDKLHFVDLPGYGYAKTAKTEREKWGTLIENYLQNRQQLKIIVLLIDIRHEASENDRMMYEWIKYYHIPVVIVATKLDKIKKSQLKKHLSIIKNSIKLNAEDEIIPYSSKTKEGREELWQKISATLEN